jgi:hypothetical protein
VAGLGREAVHMLLRLIDNPGGEPVQQFLPTQLTLRGSCGCEGASGSQVRGGVEAEPVVSVSL